MMLPKETTADWQPPHAPGLGITPKMDVLGQAVFEVN